MSISLDAMNKQSEKILVEQSRSNPEAFGILYEHYVDRIYGFLYRRTSDRELSEDLTAASFEAALKNLATYRWQETGFGAWLYRIARNKLIQHYRRQRFVAPFNAFKEKTSEKASSISFVDTLEDNDRLSRAFSRMSSKEQEILSLRFFEGLSSAEVGVILNCSKENVYLRLHRALKRMRERIEALDRVGEESYE